MELLAYVVFMSAVALVPALNPIQQAKILQIRSECITASGVGEDTLKNARQGKFTDDRKFKEFLNCFFTKIGFQNAAGDFQIDAIRSKMPANVDRKEAEKVISKCKDVKGTDAADTAYKGYTCYWNATPNHLTLVSM